jgi:SAM-dependent methyltransferase
VTDGVTAPDLSAVVGGCPVCGAGCHAFDSVDLNKSCEELNGTVLPTAGIPIEYVVCEDCGFCFAPAMCRWPLDEFSARIYNDEYTTIDPGCVAVRPSGNAAHLLRWFGERGQRMTHLDYGGGQGLLSRLLRDAGWNSRSYDPFFDRGAALADLGKFDLITAYEVFEHVPDVNALAADLVTLLNPEGIVVFSTVPSDGFIAQGGRLTWWYAAPRNGHISLFSLKSLDLLARKFGFNFGTYAPGLHAFWRRVPSWVERSAPTPDAAGNS